MTESSSSTHDTPASLKEALHLAIDSLPTQSSSFGQISAGLVLEAINRLQFKGFSQDDQLAAILWTLPRKEALCLAPNYLIEDIDAVSNLWEVFLIHLSYQTSSDQLSSATIGTAISKAPARARSILSVFLTVANEHCCRSMSTDIPNTVSKPYLQNLLAIARALEKNAVDTTADDLVASVENAIDKAHLTGDLTPERTWVWQIRALTNLSTKDAQPVVELLRRILRYMWLTTGSYPDNLGDHTEFFVRIERSRNGVKGSVDRLMASIAARFGKLFDIRKVRFSDKLHDVQWSRRSIHSWAEGLRHQAVHDRLLSDTHADPLAAIASFDEDSTVADQLKAFYNKFVQLK